MLKLNHSILSLLIAVFFPCVVLGQTLDIKYLDEKLSYYPEAQRFEATYKDLILQGIELGPKEGIPVVFAGGFTSNLPIYRKLMREFAKRGFRVFNYNPPGQGAGSLVSKGDNPRWQSFRGLVQALELMHRTVYKLTDQKVLVAGHSLGGMQARVFSLGLKGLLTDQVKVDPKKVQEVLDHTIGIVPIFSPSLAHMTSRLGDSPYEKMVMRISEIAMRRAMPLTMETYSTIMKYTPNILIRYFHFLNNRLLKPFDPVNELWGRVLYGRHINLAEIRETAGVSLSETIYPEIVDSLKAWHERGGAVTSDGFNMGEAWVEKQNSELAIPSLIVVAEKDSLAPKEELFEEIEDTNANSILLKGGHIDPLYDYEQVPLILDSILDQFDLVCESYFKAS